MTMKYTTNCTCNFDKGGNICFQNSVAKKNTWKTAPFENIKIKLVDNTNTDIRQRGPESVRWTKLVHGRL
jgi:hypothetical protein